MARIIRPRRRWWRWCRIPHHETGSECPPIFALQRWCVFIIISGGAEVSQRFPQRRPEGYSIILHVKGGGSREEDHLKYDELVVPAHPLFHSIALKVLQISVVVCCEGKEKRSYHLLPAKKSFLHHRWYVRWLAWLTLTRRQWRWQKNRDLLRQPRRPRHRMRKRTCVGFA